MSRFVECKDCKKRFDPVDDLIAFGGMFKCGSDFYCFQCVHKPSSEQDKKRLSPKEKPL